MIVPKFHCFTHNFSTWSISAWDKHCYETKHKLEFHENVKGKWKRTTKPYPKNYTQKLMGFVDDLREHYKFAKLLESFDGIKRTK